MPSTQELDAELVRMRRSFRLAVIAAAIGATVGAGAVITVVGAVFSVMDRPASEPRKAKVDDSKVARQRAAEAPRAGRADDSAREGSCQDQTWPYLDSRCTTKAEAPARQPGTAAAGVAPVVHEQPPAAAAGTAAGTASATSGMAPATSGAAPTNLPPPAAAAPANTAVIAPEPAREAPAAQPQPPLAQPQTQAVVQPAVQPSARSESAEAATPQSPKASVTAAEKARKKTARSRSEQEKEKSVRLDGNSRGDERARQNNVNRTVALPESRDRDSKERGVSERESWSSRSADRWDGDDEPSARAPALVDTRSRSETRSDPVVVVPASRARNAAPVRAPTEARDTVQSASSGERPRRSARSRAQPEPQVQEAAEETRGSNDRGFFGGLFGGRDD